MSVAHGITEPVRSTRSRGVKRARSKPHHPRCIYCGRAIRGRVDWHTFLHEPVCDACAAERNADWEADMEDSCSAGGVPR